MFKRIGNEETDPVRSSSELNLQDLSHLVRMFPSATPGVLKHAHYDIQTLTLDVWFWFDSAVKANLLIRCSSIVDLKDWDDGMRLPDLGVADFELLVGGVESGRTISAQIVSLNSATRELEVEIRAPLVPSGGGHSSPQEVQLSVRRVLKDTAEKTFLENLFATTGTSKRIGKTTKYEQRQKLKESMIAHSRRLLEEEMSGEDSSDGISATPEDEEGLRRITETPIFT